MPLTRRPPTRPLSFRALAALLAALAPIPAAAQAPAAQPLWEFGAVAVAVSQQAYPGSDEQVRRGLALPYLLYRGRYLRADTEGLGVRPVRTPTYELDIGVSGAFGSRAQDVQARRGMQDLGTLVEFGPRLKWNLGPAPLGGQWRLDLPLRGVFDLSDQLAFRGAVFQPALVWQRRMAGGWTLGASAGAALADRRLAQTFYEVAPHQAAPGRPAYRADAGLLAWRLGASVMREIGRDWRVIGFARLDSVTGAANRSSPLVRQTTGATVGIGVSYTWLRSQASASD